MHFRFLFLALLCLPFTAHAATFGRVRTIYTDLPRQFRMVQAWIAIHEDELMADWELAVNGEPGFPIDPLR